MPIITRRFVICLDVLAFVFIVALYTPLVIWFVDELAK